MKRSEFSTEYLKRVLLAVLKIQEAINQRMQECVRKVIGGKKEEIAPWIIEVQREIINLGLDIIVKRLQRNRRNVKIFSLRDISQLVPHIFDAMEKAEERSLDSEERESMEKALKNIIKASLEVGLSLSWEDYWEWIHAVTDVSTYYDIPPEDLSVFGKHTDKVMQRLFSREEFVLYHEKIISKLTDVNLMKKTFFLSAFESMVLEDMSKRERYAFKKKMEVELESVFKELIEKIKEPLRLWLDNEAERIYGKQ
ncbi:MAG: hypothetical protein WAV31_03000 [Candidatus Moraniibacteriota bacterium]